MSARPDSSSSAARRHPPEWRAGRRRAVRVAHSGRRGGQLRAVRDRPPAVASRGGARPSHGRRRGRRGSPPRRRPRPTGTPRPADDRRPGPAVLADRRLVGEEDGRAVEERGGDRQAPLLAAGELPRVGDGEVAELECREEGAGTLAGGGVLVTEGSRRGEDLVEDAPRHDGRARPLRHPRHRPREVGGREVAGSGAAPEGRAGSGRRDADGIRRGRLEESRERVQHGGLAGAMGPTRAVRLPGAAPSGSRRRAARRVRTVPSGSLVERSTVRGVAVRATAAPERRTASRWQSRGATSAGSTVMGVGCSLSGTQIPMPSRRTRSESSVSRTGPSATTRPSPESTTSRSTRSTHGPSTCSTMTSVSSRQHRPGAEVALPRGGHRPLRPPRAGHLATPRREPAGRSPPPGRPPPPAPPVRSRRRAWRSARRAGRPPGPVRACPRARAAGSPPGQGRRRGVER